MGRKDIPLPDILRNREHEKFYKDNLEQEGIWDDFVKGNIKMCKNIGKGLLTIASPTIGLPTFGKDLKSRVILGAVGTGISIMGSLGILELKFFGYDKEVLYESPDSEFNITIQRKHNDDLRGLAEALVSPGLFYLDSHDSTTVNIQDGASYEVRGDDVITFDNETGEYVSNFHGGRKFVDSLGDTVSLKELGDEVANLNTYGNYLEVKKKELASEGQIYGARETSKEIDANLELTKNAGLKYADALKESLQMREVYDDSVEVMNDELNSFRGSVKQEGDKE